jgi:FkbM family methyltransferase
MDVLATLKRSGFVAKSVMDVGAARGEWTRGCLSIFSGASCMMVDPLIENEPALKMVTCDFPSVKYWVGAIGEASGELKIHAHGDQSSLLASDGGGNQERFPFGLSTRSSAMVR